MGRACCQNRHCLFERYFLKCLGDARVLYGFPRLGDQLLGIVELSRHEDASRSERLVQAAMAQAADAVKDKDFTHAVPEARHARWAWALGAAALVALAAALGVSDATWNAAQRWATELTIIERFTCPRIAVFTCTPVAPTPVPS